MRFLITSCSFRGEMLERETAKNYCVAMFLRAKARRLLGAMLGLIVFAASAPTIQASPSPSPCDCPSMQMLDHSMARHMVPEKHKNAPCNEQQNCICGVSCGMAVNLLQQSLPLPSFVISNKLAWSDFNLGPGLFIKPAIPPPIPVV